jgi:hypothetical protein
MTSPNDIVHLAAQARTDDLRRAAAERRNAQRGPRSTFPSTAWTARLPAILRPSALR